MNGNNTNNLPVYLSFSQTSKNVVSLFIFYVFFFYRTGSAQEGWGVLAPVGGKRWWVRR
jgi:hypothetical protein